jgi:hypothetical protein
MQFEADPDPDSAYHFVADPDPANHFNTDPDADPDQALIRIRMRIQILSFNLMRIHAEQYLE